MTFNPKKFEKNMVKVITFAAGSAYVTLKTPECVKPTDFVTDKGYLFQLYCKRPNRILFKALNKERVK